MRNLLRKGTLFLALAGIAVEILYAATISGTFGNLLTYFIECTVLSGDRDAKRIATENSKLEKYRKLHWKIAFRFAQNLDLLAFVMVIARISLTWMESGNGAFAP